MSSRWDSPPQPTGAEASSAPSNAAAAAAAAAAKIAAQFAQPRLSPSNERSSSATAADGKDQHDAEFTHDIEINDQRNRYMLTNGPAQQQMHKETGASITTKGTWYPDKSLATKEDPPLYLHISAVSKEMLDAAIAKVNDLINQDLPQLVEDRNQRRAEYENQRPPPRERKRWPEEKVFINLDSIRNFHIKSKVVGPGGMFVKYIQSETGTRVQIKGIGSGFLETETGMELPEPMHISIAGPEEDQIKAAKALAEDLLEVVRFEWQKALDALNSGFGGQHGGQGYGGGGGGRGGYGGYAQQPHEQQYHHQHQQPPCQQPEWNQRSAHSYDHGHAQPPAPGGEPPPPPPPEDDVPPPPPSDYGRPYDQRPANSPRDNARRPDNRSPHRSPARQPAAPAPKTMTPEEAALDKYWRDYIAWEDSFRAYHNRRPTKEEGAQVAPPQYRSN